ncbi:MAG: DUF4347 domain-containing protein [Spirulinaceae cyanobacterium]
MHLISRLRSAGSLSCQTLLSLCTCICLLAPHRTLAQSITAAPDGTGTIIHYNGNTYHITGGTQAGANLFHSFQQFGLQPSEIADFLSNPTIQNVIGRVIGGDPSVIEGLIRLSGGNSNLFLVNPAGWVFTEGANVDVPGSFGVTTANRIGFGSAFFNTTGDNNYATLTGDPTSLIFDSVQPGAIINAADLNVENGSLWMIGGSVISTGSIAAPNGTVTIAAVPGESKVKLSHDGMALSFFLDALAVDEIAPETPLGIRAVDLPSYLNGSSEVGNANEVVRTENGALWLVGSQLRVENGDVVVGDRITAENVNLIAAGRVQVNNSSEIAGDTTVVRLTDASGRMTLSVIDSRAENPEDLLYGGAAGTIAKILDRDEDGIAVLTEELGEIAAESEELDAVSITAEGYEGNFWLGNAWVTSENVDDYREQLTAWQDALTDRADLLLYSCFTALGDTGAALVNSLANLTGADVAASVDATGSANYGGDWLLESRTGSIEAGNPFTPETLSTWEGKLATLTVTNSADSGAGSLRQRIQTDAAAGDMITFDTTRTVTLTTGQITWATDRLTLDGNGSTVDGNQNGRIFDISANNATIHNLTIRNGSTAGDGGGIRMVDNTALMISNSTITRNTSGDHGGGIYVDASGQLNIFNSTISRNFASSRAGGIHFGADGIFTIEDSNISKNTAASLSGGGIRFGNNGNLTMTNSRVVGNLAGNGGAGDHGGGVSFQNNGSASLNNTIISENSVSGGDGGGIRFFDDGTLSLKNSTVSGNSAGDNGGGLYFDEDGSLFLTNTTVSDNITGDDGGGIHLLNNEIVTITHSTISGNSAGEEGGGIFLNSNATIVLKNSTISGNVAMTQGGGVYAGNNTNLISTNATIAFNTASTDGGGIFLLNGVGTLNNTIASNNNAATGPELSGTFVANYSLILNPSGATISGSHNILNQDPLLQPLAFNNNFGQATTQTHAIPVNSPALNAGSNAIANAAGLTTDQRGLAARIFGGTVDIGAYELNPNADLSPFSFAEIYIDPTQITRLLLDGILQAKACRTVPERELMAAENLLSESASAESAVQSESLDLDDACYPYDAGQNSR